MVCLVSISDQGGINRGVLDYAQYMLPLALLVGYDGQHRSYNDLKSSMRASGIFRTFLGMAIVFNVGYGPAGTKVWWHRKLAALTKIAIQRGPHQEPFLSYMAKICQERGEPETGLEEQRERMWQAMLSMKGCQVHGPLTKLMRWFSWWEGYQFHIGEMWFTRLVMLYGNTCDNIGDETSMDSSLFDPETEGMTPQQELRYLKMKMGGWALAPTLVNGQSMWQASLIFEGGRPMWTKYSTMAQTVKTPDQVQDHLVFMVLGGWKQELLDLLHHAFWNVDVMKKLYFDTDDITEEHLDQHNKFVLTLVSERAMSLVAQCLKPPWRYAALCKADKFQETSQKMEEEWVILQLAERLAAEGHDIKPLAHTHFLKTPYVRLHYLANELDMRLGLSFENANGVVWAKTTCRQLGDTVCIENVHQKVKDLLHAARHDQIARVGKYQAVINSGVLESREVGAVKVSDEQKASAGKGRHSAANFTRATAPNSHKMKKAYQDVMKYKASSPNFTWPSSSHVSLCFG